MFDDADLSSINLALVPILQPNHNASGIDHDDNHQAQTGHKPGDRDGDGDGEGDGDRSVGDDGGGDNNGTPNIQWSQTLCQ